MLNAETKIPASEFEFEIQTIKGEDLAAKDITGKSDPYFKIGWWDQNSSKCTVDNGTLFP
jgi:hypothetical protein